MRGRVLNATLQRMISRYFKPAEDIAARLTHAALAEPVGFFTFGGCVCYGRNSLGHVGDSPDGDLPDLSDQADCGGICTLPFDLCEVVDNLLCEKYVSDQRGPQWLGKRAARAAYYLLRPMLGVSVRKHLQRRSLKGWEAIRFPQWPVDFTVDHLMRCVFGLAIPAEQEAPFVWFWPRGHRSCLILTHDVETAEGRDFCEALMDIDESYGFKSSFQFVPEKRYQVPESILDRICERGFEVNIHGLNHDGRLFSSHATFSGRAAQINEHGRTLGARGFRSPVLYRNARWMNELDFDYDMSFPNVAHLDPQRGGCCTVMPYFIGNMVELPLTTVQDYSLFNILGEYSIDIWTEQAKAIAANNGLISLNIHPDYLNSKQALDAYRSLLAFLKAFAEEQDCWHALPGHVAQWWRSRDAVSVSPDGALLGPQGDHTAGVRCARASAKGDKLEMRVEEKPPR